MFYVSKYDSKRNLFAVVDTSDNVEEWYNANDLLRISRKVHIKGVYEDCIIPELFDKDVLRLLTNTKYDEKFSSELYSILERFPFETTFKIEFKRCSCEIIRYEYDEFEYSDRHGNELQGLNDLVNTLCELYSFHYRITSKEPKVVNLGKI